jgi:glycosidase
LIERMGFGTGQVEPGTFWVRLAEGESLTVGLGATATSPDELAGATAFVWTNYGSADPRTFSALAMTETVPTDSHQRAFQLTLGPAALGTFIVTAYLEVGNVRHWAPDHPDIGSFGAEFGLANRLVFRVTSADINGLYVREVPIDKANARSDSTDISMIEDLLEEESGWYSLKKLHDEGVNCVWFQVPYRIDPWDGLDPADDAGSDYASTDWFSIDPELSHDSRGVPPWDLDRQRQLTNAAMKRLVDKAHDFGMKVLFEIAPNHVGHNFIFRDAFEDAGAVDVRRRDYGQAAIDPAQLNQVDQRLASPDYDEPIKNYAEWMLPQMYAAYYPDGRYNPFGATTVYETYSPDWYGKWADVKHLNHGGHAGQHIWIPVTPQNFHVLAYIGRAMAWAVTELGADGFRIDHALGMPFHFFEQTLPWVEMKARERRGPGTSLIWVPEDHNRKDYTRCVADIVQSMGYMELLSAFAAQDVDRIWRAFGEVEREAEFLATGNHDERRGVQFFSGDVLAYGNAVITMQLFGGPMVMLAGDEYAEGQQLRFKTRGGVPTIWQLRQGLLPEANSNLAYWISRGAELKSTHPALRGATRERLTQSAGNGPHPIFAWSHPGDDATNPPLMMFSNLDRQSWATGTFDVGSYGRGWLTRGASSYYQIRDLVGFDPGRYLWSRPRLGQDLLDNGLGVGLQPKQIQALELVVVV